MDVFIENLFVVPANERTRLGLGHNHRRQHRFVLPGRTPTLTTAPLPPTLEHESAPGFDPTVVNRRWHRAQLLAQPSPQCHRYALTKAPRATCVIAPLDILFPPHDGRSVFHNKRKRVRGELRYIIPHFCFWHFPPPTALAPTSIAFRRYAETGAKGHGYF